MMQDFWAVDGETIDEITPEDQIRTFPAFYHSSWQAEDGKKAFFIVNYLDREQVVAVDGKEYNMPPCSVCKQDPENGQITFYNK